MNKLRIFVDFATPPEVRERLREGTRGHELIFPALPAKSVLTAAAPDPRFVEAEIAFGQPSLRAIAEAPRLKWIHISTSSITRYDTPELRDLLSRRGILLSNSASVYNEACATHTLSFMLAQARQLPRSLAARSAGGSDEWLALRHACVPLAGQSVVILGYGAIAARLVEMLRPFSMKISGYRRKTRGDETVPILRVNELDAAMSDADHVVNILPENAETRRFFDRARFDLLKAGAIFYNIGRGATVDQEELLVALQSRRMGAAWLDVTDPEPLPNDHPLRFTPNCFITPHVAGGHANETATLVRHFLRNLERFSRGEPLLDRVI